MEIVIHQAICGEQNKAWDLLKTTLPDISIAKKIAFKADLQDSPPSGVVWESVIRGFLLNDYYLIIKTYPDNSAEVRNGRVFSHCLLISKKDLPNVSNLGLLLPLFKEEIDKSITIEPIILDLKETSNNTFEDPLRLRFNRAIQCYTKLSNGDNTIVWVGQKDFEKAICQFWRLLSPLQKESFNFGINFTPNEISKDKINFITIPENIESKFLAGDFCLIRKDEAIELTEFSEQFLAGDSNATKRISAFIRAIEAEKFSKGEISTLAKGVNTFESLNTITDLRLLNTLANIVAKYSPDEAKGILFKNELINRICIVVALSDEKQILMLKNFPIKSFAGSANKLSNSVDNWITDILFSEPYNKKYNCSSLINQIYDASSLNWWISLFKKRIKDFLSNIEGSSSLIIWCWINNDNSILNKISSEIGGSREIENYFLLTFPSVIPEASVPVIKKFAVQRKWFRLHAMTLKSGLSFEMALDGQLKIDNDEHFYEGLEIIMNGIKPKTIIAITLSNREQRCIDICAELCKNDTKLLGSIEIENLTWQSIWVATLKKGVKITAGIKAPKRIIFRIFDALVERKSVNEELLEIVSETEFANILDYPQRAKVWTRFPFHLKNKFLSRTSLNFLETLGKTSSIQVDPEMVSYIFTGNFIATFLTNKSIKSALPIFAVYSQLPEYMLRDFIFRYTGKIDVVDSKQLGKLVLNRRYYTVAEAIHQKFYFDRNYKYALIECAQLLGFFTKIYLSRELSNVEVTKDEWWDAFEGISFKLYSSGPLENKIWTQANGKDYDLLTRGTGKEIWIAALRKLRNGGCEKITVVGLLKAMYKEHSKNEELQMLIDLWKKL